MRSPPRRLPGRVVNMGPQEGRKGGFHGYVSLASAGFHLSRLNLTSSHSLCSASLGPSDPTECDLVNATQRHAAPSVRSNPLPPVRYPNR